MKITWRRKDCPPDDVDDNDEKGDTTVTYVSTNDNVLKLSENTSYTLNVTALIVNGSFTSAANNTSESSNSIHFTYINFNHTVYE